MPTMRVPTMGKRIPFEACLLVLMVGQICGRVVTPKNPGPPLRPYKEEPVNNRLTAGMDSKVAVPGKSLDMWCKLQLPAKNEMKTCEWLSPTGKAYFVQDGVLWDSALDKPAEGIVLAADDLARDLWPRQGSTSCRIRVLELDPSDHVGKWTCNVRLTDTDQFQSAVLTVKTTPELVKDVRLPKTFEPVSYDVYLTPFLVVDNFTVEGHVDIRLKVKEGSKVKGSEAEVAKADAQYDRITVHAYKITIYENTVNLKQDEQGQVKVKGHGYDQEREFYTVHLDRELVPGQEVTLSMDFQSLLSNDLSGFYRSDYVDKASGEVRYLATTQFESTDARKAFPCMDEPSLKAVFNIWLGHHPEMVALSNMPLVQTLSMADNHEYVWAQFLATPVMSTYLLAFVVSDFEGVVSKPPNGDERIRFTTWARKDLMKYTSFASEVGPAITYHFEKYFDLEFPLPKQDLIAIPDFSAGAMENWGLITFREVYLLYEEGVSSLSGKEDVANVIAHELAHQWFGNIVTMEWWTE